MKGLKCLKAMGLKILKYQKSGLLKITYYLIALLPIKGFLIFKYLTASIILKTSKNLFIY